MITIGDIQVYHCPIPPGERSMRHRREVAAIRSLIDDAIGPDALLCHHDDGAPYIAGSEVSISISHSIDTAVLAVDRHGRPIGVDIESWRDSLRNVASRLLSVDEQRWASDDNLLLTAWTIKEAVYKALRPTGISMLEIALPHCPTPQGVASGVHFTTTHIGAAVVTIAVL